MPFNKTPEMPVRILYSDSTFCQVIYLGLGQSHTFTKALIRVMLAFVSTSCVFCWTCSPNLWLITTSYIEILNPQDTEGVLICTSPPLPWKLMMIIMVVVMMMEASIDTLLLFCPSMIIAGTWTRKPYRKKLVLFILGNKANLLWWRIYN